MSWCFSSIYKYESSLKEVVTQANRYQKGSHCNGLYCYSALKCSSGHSAVSLRAAHFHVQPVSRMSKDIHYLSLPPSYPLFLLTSFLLFFLALQKLYKNQPVMSHHGALPPHSTNVQTPPRNKSNGPGRREWISWLRPESVASYSCSLILILTINFGMLSFSSENKVVWHSSPSHLPTVNNEIRRLREDSNLFPDDVVYFVSSQINLCCLGILQKEQLSKELRNVVREAARPSPLWPRSPMGTMVLCSTRWRPTSVRMPTPFSISIIRELPFSGGDVQEMGLHSQWAVQVLNPLALS